MQEGVPQCIKQLAQAGIRLWVLTGDKMVSVGTAAIFHMCISQV